MSCSTKRDFTNSVINLCPFPSADIISYVISSGTMSLFDKFISSDVECENIWNLSNSFIIFLTYSSSLFKPAFQHPYESSRVVLSSTHNSKYSPCLFGDVLPYFKVTGDPVPVSSLRFKCSDCFIWNCSYIVYPSKMKGSFRDNCLRYFSL